MDIRGTIRLEDANSLARSVDERLDLSAYIERWNDGAPNVSVISTFRDLVQALALDLPRWDLYMDEILAAKASGIDLRLGLFDVLRPVIRKTSDRVIRIRSEAWAAKVALAGPRPFLCEENLGGKTEWISWCIHHIHPPALPSPEGTHEVSRTRTKRYLRRSLAARFDDAVAAGWLSAGDDRIDAGLDAGQLRRYRRRTIADMRRVAATPIERLLDRGR